MIFYKTLPAVQVFSYSLLYFDVLIYVLFLVKCAYLFVLLSLGQNDPQDPSFKVQVSQAFLTQGQQVAELNFV